MTVNCDQSHLWPDCTGIHDTAASVVNPNYLPKSGSTHGPSQGWENRGPHGRIAARLCDAAVGPYPSGGSLRPSGLPSAVIECVIEADGRVEWNEIISILRLGMPVPVEVPHCTRLVCGDRSRSGRCDSMVR